MASMPILGKVESQDAYILTDGVQVDLNKCIRRIDQDWSKYLAIYKSVNAYSSEYQLQCHQEEQKHSQEDKHTFLESM